MVIYYIISFNHNHCFIIVSFIIVSFIIISFIIVSFIILRRFIDEAQTSFIISQNLYIKNTNHIFSL
jgi:hypothetical protein